MLRAAGIVALFVLATACGQSTAKPAQSPIPTVHGSWVLNLTFAGDINGQMSAIVANSGTNVSECTGLKSHSGDPWSDAFYGMLDSGTQVWGVTFLVNGYRGAGIYKDSDVSVQVHSPTDSTKVWQNVAGDAVTFTIYTTLESGAIDAELTNATSGKVTQHLTGTWGCRG
jgi:hypothetical protein